MQHHGPGGPLQPTTKSSQGGAAHPEHHRRVRQKLRAAARAAPVHVVPSPAAPDHRVRVDVHGTDWCNSTAMPCMGVSVALVGMAREGRNAATIMTTIADRGRAR